MLRPARSCTCSAGTRILYSGAHFSPDGKRVLTVSSQTEQSNRNRTESGKPEPEPDPTVDAGITTRPFRVESSSSGGFGWGSARRADKPFARLWSTESGKQIGQLDFSASRSHFGFFDSRPNAVAFSADGSRVAVGFNDDQIGVWDASGGEARAVLSGHRGQVLAVAFSPDGSYLATGGAGPTVFLWDVQTGQVARRLEGHLPRNVQDVQFSADGRRLVTAGADQTARVWQVSTGKELAVFRGHNGTIEGATSFPVPTRSSPPGTAPCGCGPSRRRRRSQRCYRSRTLRPVGWQLSWARARSGTPAPSPPSPSPRTANQYTPVRRTGASAGGTRRPAGRRPRWRGDFAALCRVWRSDPGELSTPRPT